MFINNMDWTKLIDWFLRIVQILTFIGILIKTSNKNEYVDNVKLEEVSYQDINSIYCNKKFHMVFSFGNAEHETNHYLFYPVGTDLKKVSIYSIKDNIKYDQKLETFRGINNGRGLIINLSIIGTVPHHMIRWETTSGEIGEYVFQMNGFNGNMDFSEYKYKYSIIGKLKKIFGM